MTLLKNVLRIHKWIALIVGIQIFLWVLGGLVMSAIPIEEVRGEHKIASQAPLTHAPDELISVQDAAEAAHFTLLRSAELGRFIDRPVWRLVNAEGARDMVDARTGALLSPLTETMAKAAASADYRGDAVLTGAVLFNTPPREFGGRGPVWRVSVDDGDDTTLYVDAITGEIRARRSSTWRFYDLFWRLHVMDYDDGEDFNHPLLITAAGASLFVALSGLALLVFRMRRLVTAAMSRRKARSP